LAIESYYYKILFKTIFSIIIISLTNLFLPFNLIIYSDGFTRPISAIKQIIYNSGEFIRYSDVSSFSTFDSTDSFCYITTFSNKTIKISKSYISTKTIKILIEILRDKIPDKEN